MTKERLDRLRVLRREITRTKRRIVEIRANSIDTPQGKCAMHRLEERLTQYLTEAAEEAEVLMEYINNIEDLNVREIFMLRYYDGIGSWQKIAFEIGEYDESLLRRRHNAYLKKGKECL